MKMKIELERRDWAWVGLLTGIALAMRLACERAVVFPPLDDPAFYLSVARNVVAGRGLVIDALWSYRGGFPAVTHPAFEHWMPLPSLLMVPCMALLGATLRAGQIPGLLMGTALAPLTYLLGRGCLGRKMALIAGLLVACNATLAYQSASADSAAPYALVGLLALWAISGRRWVLAGLLVGLGYLTRADGLLLAIVALGMLLWAAYQERWPWRQGLVALWMIIGGWMLVVGPWLVRQWFAFGTPVPLPAVEVALMPGYLAFFRYPPDAGPPVSGAAFWGLRWAGLGHNLGVFLVTTFPWGVLGVVGLAYLWNRDQVWRGSAAYSLLLFLFTALVFPVTTLAGTYYHSLGATVPFLALGAVTVIAAGLRWMAIRRSVRRTYLDVAIAALLALAVGQMILSLPAVAQRHREEQATFAAAASWLENNVAANAAIMTTQPHTLHWVTSRLAIVLPPNDPPHAAQMAARVYGAEWLVITQTWGPYPAVVAGFPLLVGDEGGGWQIYCLERLDQ
jgi:hypothetical protein